MVGCRVVAGNQQSPATDNKISKECPMSVQPHLLSIVCPAFKEEEVLPLFHRELAAVLATLDESYRVESLHVDDGSPDQTLAVMKTLASQDHRVRFFSLSRNFGKEAALLAGMEH